MVIHFSYVISGEEHEDDLWESTTPTEFYNRMRAGEIVTTAAVPPGHYLNAFRKAAEQKKPTVYLGFTGGLSSSINSAFQARDILQEEVPDFELHVVDTCAPSAAAELLAIEAVRQAAHGMTAKELATWAAEASNFIHGIFTLESFDALARGGRIPPAAASIGGKLDIKPVLSYDLNGSLTLRGICRGRKKALRSLLDDFKKNYLCEEGSELTPIGIASADDDKSAQWLADQIRKDAAVGSVPIIFSSISPVIGAHVGPGMVALVYWGSDRREKLSVMDRLARKVKEEL